MKSRDDRAEPLDVSVSPRRTSLAAAVAALALLAGPASAEVTSGGWTAIANVVQGTAVAPRTIALASDETEVAEPAEATPAQRDALRRKVEAALGGSSATVVSAAVDVQGYGAVVRRDSAHALPPASTQKSYIGLAALVALGPQARYRTEAAAVAVPVGGTLPGSLWLVAGGDPYLSAVYLRGLAKKVRALGITRVAGDVKLDDMRYDQRRAVAGWKPTFMPDESGPLSALAVNRNRWRTDSTFLADPAFPNAVLFRDYLRSEGVAIGGTVRREPRPANAQTLAVHHGTPLSSAVRRALKESDNFAAELILKEVGRVVRGEGSSAGGLAAVREVLGRHAVPMGAGSDGSGLSSFDRQTTAGQVQLLQAADASGSGPSFRAALPIGCRDGTLKHRYCGTAAEGRVSAKTGTLKGVRALAGVTTTASGRQVHFAFQLTGVTSGTSALAAIDRAVVALAASTD